MFELAENKILEKPRNSHAIPFLYYGAKKIFYPINTIVRFFEFGKISAGLIHDLMGPVTALSIYVSRLEKENKEVSYLSESGKSIEEILDVFRNNFSNIEERKYFNLNKVIESSISLMKYKSTINNVRLIFLNNLPNQKIFGKEFKLFQSITNLISNSIDSYENKDSSNRKDVIVKIFKENNFIKISVRDFGCGIKEKDKKKIFKYFYTDKQNGTGIGLPTVHRIIKRDFGGEIKFESKKGLGSTFYISIPIKNSPQSSHHLKNYLYRKHL